MTQRKRYLVQVSTQAGQPRKLRLADIAADMSSSQVVRSGKGNTRVFELSEAEASELVRNYPELLIEEDQPLQLLGSMPSLGFQVTPGRSHDHTWQIIDGKTEEPIPDVTVFAQGRSATYKGRSNDKGAVTVTAFESTIDRLIVSPAAHYWSRVIAPDHEGPIALTPLIPGELAPWGRTSVGLAENCLFRGEGVRVALIDSGVVEHDDLAIAGGFNALSGHDSDDFLRDEQGHGTHCAGIVGGRNAGQGVLGIAPDAELYAIKVYPDGYLSDLLDGLQWAIDTDIDVVNISLGVAEPSLQLAMKLAQAAARGIVMVAAAGNDAGELNFPASDEHVLAITAFGNCRSFPADSAHALRVGELHNTSNGLFVANFCNVGPQTAFIAPGVGIVSCVPNGYAAWDGTSMASPFISGLVAVLLSAYPELRTGDSRQILAVRQLLEMSATDLGLQPSVQGAGVPQASVALSDALCRRESALHAVAQSEMQRKQIDQLMETLESMQAEIVTLRAQLD